MVTDQKVYQKALKDIEGLEEKDVRAFVRGYKASVNKVTGRPTPSQQKLLETLYQLAQFRTMPSRVAILILCVLPEDPETRAVLESLREFAQPVKDWTPQQKTIYTALQDGWYTYANGGR